MTRSYPRFLEETEKKIGKVYPWMRKTGTHNYPDHKYAFHVSSGKITTYEARDESSIFSEF